MVTPAAVKQFSLGCDYGYTNRSSKSAAEGNARRSLPLLSARPPVTSPATESLSIDRYQTTLVNDRATCVYVCERLVRGRRRSGTVEVKPGMCLNCEWNAQSPTCHAINNIRMLCDRSRDCLPYTRTGSVSYITKRKLHRTFKNSP